MKTDVGTMKTDVAGLKSDVDTIKTDVTSLETAWLLQLRTPVALSQLSALYPEAPWVPDYMQWINDGLDTNDDADLQF